MNKLFLSSLLTVCVFLMMGCGQKDNSEVEVLEVLGHDEVLSIPDGSIKYEDDKPSVKGPNTLPFVKGPTSPPPNN